jgi:hypothetical protein
MTESCSSMPYYVDRGGCRKLFLGKPFPLQGIIARIGMIILIPSGHESMRTFRLSLRSFRSSGLQVYYRSTNEVVAANLPSEPQSLASYPTIVRFIERYCP